MDERLLALDKTVNYVPKCFWCKVEAVFTEIRNTGHMSQSNKKALTNIYRNSNTPCINKIKIPLQSTHSIGKQIRSTFYNKYPNEDIRSTTNILTSR